MILIYSQHQKPEKILKVGCRATWMGLIIYVLFFFVKWIFLIGEYCKIIIHFEFLFW